MAFNVIFYFIQTGSNTRKITISFAMFVLLDFTSP